MIELMATVLPEPPPQAATPHPAEETTADPSPPSPAAGITSSRIRHCSGEGEEEVLATSEKSTRAAVTTGEGYRT